VLIKVFNAPHCVRKPCSIPLSSRVREIEVTHANKNNPQIARHLPTASVRGTIMRYACSRSPRWHRSSSFTTASCKGEFSRARTTKFGLNPKLRRVHIPTCISTITLPNAVIRGQTTIQQEKCIWTKSNVGSNCTCIVVQMLFMVETRILDLGNEEAKCRQALEECPTRAIRDDGEG